MSHEDSVIETTSDQRPAGSEGVGHMADLMLELQDSVHQADLVQPEGIAPGLRLQRVQGKYEELGYTRPPNSLRLASFSSLGHAARRNVTESAVVTLHMDGGAMYWLDRHNAAVACDSVHVRATDAYRALVQMEGGAPLEVSPAQAYDLMRFTFANCWPAEQQYAERLASVKVVSATSSATERARDRASTSAAVDRHLHAASQDAATPRVLKMNVPPWDSLDSTFCNPGPEIEVDVEFHHERQRWHLHVPYEAMQNYRRDALLGATSALVQGYQRCDDEVAFPFPIYYGTGMDCQAMLDS